MQLLVTAPIRLEFTLNSSQTAFKNKDFFSFWEMIEKLNYTDSKFDHIAYYKNKNHNNEKKSYDDTDKTSLALIGIDVLKLANNTLESFKTKDQFAKDFFNSIIKSEIKIHDNTIAIFDLRVELIALSNKEESFTKDCESKIKEIIKEILLEISTSLDSFFTFLNQNNKFDIIQTHKDYKYNDFVDFFKENKNLEIMWASCAIKYDKLDTDFQLLDYWLKDAESETDINYIKSNSDSFSLEWLKYAFREDVENYEELWDTMFLAQYYYAVIEIIIYNLKFIINESYKINSEKKSLFNLFKKNKIVLVNKKLESIAEIAYLHIIEYKDAQKYLKRTNLSVFNKILDAWTFDNLVENTQDLLTTVKERVDLIYNKISTKNNFYTDILLTFIGFFAIIDLVLSFSQYSREYTADAMISSRGSDNDSVLNSLATIPIDTFIGSGFLISIVLLVVYFIYRIRILP